MNKKLMIIGFISLLMLIMAACGGGDKPKQSTTASGSKNAGIENSGDAATKTIEYLGKKYTIPKKPKKSSLLGQWKRWKMPLYLMFIRQGQYQ